MSNSISTGSRAALTDYILAHPLTEDETGYVAMTQPLLAGTALPGTGQSGMIAIDPIRNPGGGFASYDVSNGNTVKTAFQTFEIQGIDDPLVAKQWHLTRLGDLNTVWKDYTGKDVHVGVYDSGVQYSHWDLSANYDASREVVVDGVKYDGDYSPTSGPHGTAVAGLIAAAQNGEGGVGIAYDAALTSVNIFDPYSENFSGPGIFVNSADLTKFFDAISQSARFDVSNHSWGGRSPIMTATSRLTEGSFGYEMVSALSNGTDNGRGGLGTIHVAAAGNSMIDGQSDTWKTDRHVIAVGGYRESDGSSSYYVSSGAHLLVSGPTNDYEEIGGTGQVTTDLLNRDGYNTTAKPYGKSDYTDGFGGTSGATPVVSGVVTLMLDANETLGWRDVRDILAYSAKLPVAFETGQTAVTYLDSPLILNNSQFQLGGKGANWNGGETHYSRDYGYGAVDAYSAVRMAEVWSLFGAAKTSANEVSISTGDIAVGLSTVQQGTNTNATLLNDFVGTPQSFKFEVTDTVDVEHLDLTVNFKLSSSLEGFVTDLSLFGAKLKLIAPDGPSAFIDTFQNIFGFFDGTIRAAPGANEFTFGLTGFRGVDMRGTWTLQFEENADLDFGATLTINSLKLDAYGSAATTDDVHTYTDEFFTMAAIAGEADRAVLLDRNGGIDWINAAAVSSDVALNLAVGGVTTFGGQKAFTIGNRTAIENAVTGDGDDSLSGNSLANALHGMRGDDALYGLGGNDKLDGGSGNDWLDGGKGSDLLTGGTGNDSFFFDNAATSGVDRIVDFSSGDRLIVTRALRDGNGDGIITFGANGVLNLDSSNRGDRVTLDGVDPAQGLKFVGMENGFYVYTLNETAMMVYG